jgi:hypothetical protein
VLCTSAFGSTALTLFTRTGFPLALTEQSADRASNEVTAGAAVKKAAQQVETQAQILTTQLNNRVRGTEFCEVSPFVCCRMMISKSLCVAGAYEFGAVARLLFAHGFVSACAVTRCSA